MVSTEDVRSVVARLAAFPHRGSGTSYEREAAAYARALAQRVLRQ